MMYSVEMNVFENMHIEAQDADEAVVLAQEEAMKVFDVMPDQITITNVKEVN